MYFIMRRKRVGGAGKNIITNVTGVFVGAIMKAFTCTVCFAEVFKFMTGFVSHGKDQHAE
jgi:hypothetical protein